MTLFDDPVPAAPSGPSVRVRLLVAYDGTGFSGFAPNPGVRTVGGTLKAAVERVLRHEVVLSMAGRTDAGVHARGQVVSFDAAADVDVESLRRSVNRQCGPSIVVRAADVVDDRFDARHCLAARVNDDHFLQPGGKRTAEHRRQGQRCR